jgi:hypothetical protein
MSPLYIINLTKQSREKGRWIDICTPVTALLFRYKTVLFISVVVPLLHKIVLFISVVVPLQNRVVYIRCCSVTKSCCLYPLLFRYKTVLFISVVVPLQNRFVCLFLSHRPISRLSQNIQTHLPSLGWLGKLALITHEYFCLL